MALTDFGTVCTPLPSATSRRASSYFSGALPARGVGGRANGILMDSVCRIPAFHVAFFLSSRFIYLLNFQNTIPKHRRTYFKRPEETSKISPKNLSLLFSPISWSSTRKRDVSKLRGITGLGFPRSTECGTPPVRVYPLFDSHPGRIFEGPFSSRAASKRVFASSVTGTSYGEEGGGGRNPCKHRGP